MYCKYCGEELPEGSVYCSACGNQLEISSTGVAPKTTMPVSPQGQPRYVKQSEIRRSGGPVYTKDSGTNWIIACLGIIIIGCIIFAVFVAAMVFLVFPYLQPQMYQPRYLGTEDFAISVGDGTTTDLNLDLSNTVGWIDMKVDSALTADYIFVNQKIYTSKMDLSYDVNRVADFHSNSTGDVTTVTFDSYEGHENYYYHLTVTINPNVALGLKVHTTTGLITFESQEELTLTNLDVEATTGGVDLNFQDTTYLNFTQGFISTTTGFINLASANFNMAQDCTLDITTTTGGNNIDLTQTIDFGHTLTINTATSTGFTEVNAAYGSSVGLSVIAETSTGSIDFVGLSNGVTTNYASTTTHINFDLETNTGGIDFTASEA
ncbi:MAG: zinc ribbon domain-containing protein [Candidatus Hermodarchaeota archaeon]